MARSSWEEDGAPDPLDLSWAKRYEARVASLQAVAANLTEFLDSMPALTAEGRIPVGLSLRQMNILEAMEQRAGSLMLLADGFGDA